MSTRWSLLPHLPPHVGTPTVHTHGVSRSLSSAHLQVGPGGVREEDVLELDSAGGASRSGSLFRKRIGLERLVCRRFERAENRLHN